MPVAADDQTSMDTDQNTNENSTIPRIGEMLKDSTSTLRSANEAKSAMSSMIVGYTDDSRRCTIVHRIKSQNSILPQDIKLHMGTTPISLLPMQNKLSTDKYILQKGLHLRRICRNWTKCGTLCASTF